MSPLFLLPYLLYFLYHSYVAIKKRTTANKASPLVTDAEKGRLMTAPEPTPLPERRQTAATGGININTGATSRGSIAKSRQYIPPLSKHEPSLDDRQDFADAERGFVAALEPGVIRSADGTRVVWSVDDYAFLDDPRGCPRTAHPYLWRQGQLSKKQGLFEITPGLYQMRALDVSNMTIVEGATGIVIIDPLISTECARAAVELYFAHRGRRAVRGLVYSHAHADHYTGAVGAVPDGFDEKSVPIIAPAGFLEAIVSENVIAGPAMQKRALFMYGAALPRGPRGHVGNGLGLGISTGEQSLLLPNVLIEKTGEEHVVDGVRIVFQMVPDTEAPAEVNLFFPDLKVLCVPEMSTNTMHNIITLRGAQVRDAKAWSGYLDEAISLFAGEADVLVASHNWPTWGRDNLVKRLSEQRDMYGFMHDQTVRLMNQGKTGTEIAEILELPPAISRAWHCRGFYGSLNHNVKGIYQRYLTWFDGHPAHLWQYPPKEEGQRYVESFGGIDALCDQAERFLAQGDSRFAATLLSHAVAAEGLSGWEEGETATSSSPSPRPRFRARRLLIRAYKALGFACENATWRNFFLTGALELRSGRDLRSLVPSRATLAPNLPAAQWFDILSVQLDGARAAAKDTRLAIDIEIVDELPSGGASKWWRLLLSNGALTRRRKTSAVGGYHPEPRDLSITVTRKQLLAILEGRGRETISYDGDLAALDALLELVSDSG